MKEFDMTLEELKAELRLALQRIEEMQAELDRVQRELAARYV